MNDHAAKTHRSALVLIPPEDLWEPIQAIRRVHDPQIGRWMPHITLLYPFVPEDEFGPAAARIELVRSELAPVAVELRELRFFVHGPASATLWLEPEPAEPTRRAQQVLVGLFPACDDTSRHAGGFTPHLSVGTFRGRADAQQAARRLQATWTPLAWTARAVHLIARSGLPDDPFHICRSVALG